MKKFQVSIVGCGRVGKTLGYLLSKIPTVGISNLIDMSIEEALNAKTFIGGGDVSSNYRDLKSSNLWIVSTSDMAIKDACASLVRSNVLKKDDILIHCSGSLSSEILNEAKEIGCIIGSLHPSSTFANPQVSIKSFSGTYCCFEGEEKAYDMVLELFTKIGGRVMKISSNGKIGYHLASVFASNYVVALADISKHLFEKSGINNTVALEIIGNLVNKAISNAGNEPIDIWKAITGPICRNDSEVIRKHISFIENELDILEIYKRMGRYLLNMIPEEIFDKSELKAILNSSR